MIDPESKTMITANAYCEMLVRNYDKDHYVIGLCYGRDQRADLWPLFAFHYEIAKTRTVVSEPTLGLIRLQWWRDTLTEMVEKGSVGTHEILPPLWDITTRHHLLVAHLHTMIDIRERDMDEVIAPDEAGLWDYARDLQTPLTRLVLKVLGEEAPDYAIETISSVYMVSVLLRALDGEHMLFHKFPFLLKEGAVEVLTNDALKRLNMKAPAPYLRRLQTLSKLYLTRMKQGKFDVHNPHLSAPPTGFLLRALIGIA